MASYLPSPGRSGSGPTQQQAWYNWLGASSYKQEVAGARNRANQLRTVDAAAAARMDSIISQTANKYGSFDDPWNAWWQLGDVYDSAWSNYNTQQQELARKQQEEALAAQRAAEAEQARLREEQRKQQVLFDNQRDLGRVNADSVLNPDAGTGLASRLLGGTALEEGRRASAADTPASAVGSSTPTGDESTNNRKNRKRGGLSSAVGINL